MTDFQQLAGQSADIDKLFRQYHRELNRFAYKKLRDREAASDLVQDAFARLLSHLQTGVVPESPRFFLWRIANNLLIDLLRRDRRRGASVPFEALADELSTRRRTPSAILSRGRSSALSKTRSMNSRLRHGLLSCSTGLKA